MVIMAEGVCRSSGAKQVSNIGPKNKGHDK
jgi:hypothetical protein